MKACIYTQYGPPSILRIKEVEQPVPQSNELLIRVHAATVNRTDCAILRAKPFFMRFVAGLFGPNRQTPGTDFAGKVEAVGEAVRSFKVGDRVFGFNDLGVRSHAEYMVIAEDQPIAVIPPNCSYRHAAASIEGAHYAYNFINKVNLEPESKVMVNGATGAIGSAALQLLKHFGTKVTAVGNTKNLKLLANLGADRVIDYEREDFTQDTEQYDFVFDTVGKSSFGRCKRLLKPGGAYISSELGWMAENLFFALTTPLTGGKKVIFPVPTSVQSSIDLVRKLLEEGSLKPVIDRVYPLDSIVEAFTYVETGQKTGNVVVSLDDNDDKT